MAMSMMVDSMVNMMHINSPSLDELRPKTTQMMTIEQFVAQSEANGDQCDLGIP